MNRIGNLHCSTNDNYCKFEDWLTPILNAMLAEQKETGQGGHLVHYLETWKGDPINESLLSTGPTKCNRESFIICNDIISRYDNLRQNKILSSALR